jgi:hypothetical protein
MMQAYDLEMPDSPAFWPASRLGAEVTASPDNIYVYRLWRLRRLIAFSLFLPALAIGVLWAVSGGSALATQPTVAGPILFASVVNVILLVVWFPRATAEAVKSCMVWVCLILASPMVELLLDQLEGPMQPKHYFGLAFLLFLAWALLEFGIAHALDWLIRVAPRTTFSWSCIVATKLTATAAFHAIRPAPDRMTGFGRFGAADDTGRFGVWINFRLIDTQGQASLAAADEKQSPPSYWMTVEDTGPLSCRMIAEVADGGASVTHLVVEPNDQGARILQTETSSFLNWPLRFLFYLDDAAKDYLLGQIDEAEGRVVPRSNRLQPKDSPALWLTRLLSEKPKLPYF